MHAFRRNDYYNQNYCLSIIEYIISYDTPLSYSLARVSSPTNLAISYLSNNSITFSWCHNTPQHSVPIAKYCLILPLNTTCTNDNRTFEMTLPVNGYQNFTVFLVNIGGPLTIPSYPESIFLILKCEFFFHFECFVCI